MQSDFVLYYVGNCKFTITQQRSVDWQTTIGRIKRRSLIDRVCEWLVVSGLLHASTI